MFTGLLSVSRCVSGGVLTLTIVLMLSEVRVVFSNMSALHMQLEYTISSAKMFYCSGKLALKTDHNDAQKVFYRTVLSVAMQYSMMLVKMIIPNIQRYNLLKESD